MFDHRHYVPIVKWRQGEYQALWKLSADVKDNITPLLEIPEEAWDFEAGAPKKTLDEHTEKFGKRLKEKWGGRRCLIDSCYLSPVATCANGEHHLSRLISLAEAEGCNVVPVTGLSRHMDYQKAVLGVTSEYKRGICLRLVADDYDRSDLKGDITELLDYFSLSATDVDLVIDSKEFVPNSAVTYAITMLGFLGNTPYINRWRSLTVSGTAFPATINAVNYRPNGRAKRFEWLGYKNLIGRLNDKDRIPSFSDYTVSHPQTGNLDPRLMDPNAKIKYTVEDDWFIVVGSQVKKNGRSQYRSHCDQIVNAIPKVFDGEKFSWGDLYIYECSTAQGTATTGGTSTWPSVTNNHHITRVVYELSNLYAI
ncbi:beta family protein [Pseudomonas sp. SBT1-2]|uniref:beta family protein n=1 Tax=Pseudomonas sp. SBT1-2 TaxID=3027852 RepID=UPI0023628817|nr:beta family protein [Pseudomonas sp. SBT1-2]